MLRLRPGRGAWENAGRFRASSTWQRGSPSTPARRVSVLRPGFERALAARCSTPAPRRDRRAGSASCSAAGREGSQKNRPARVIVRDGHVLLVAGGTERPCGKADPNGWTAVNVETRSERTRAGLDGGSFAEVQHRPAATWVYLGEAFPKYGTYPGTSLLIDVDSVGTRVGVRP